jgi:hypothetical protein
MKLLELTALDGSKWVIPLTVIARNHGEYYAPIEHDGDIEKATAEALEMFESDEDAATDWAANNMNWSDVREHATMVKGADDTDMQDSWIEGDMVVIDGAEPAAADVAARAAEVLAVTKEAYACTRCGASCVGGEKIDCDRGPCPMELRSVTVEAPSATVSVNPHKASTLDSLLREEGIEALCVPVPLDADEVAALKLRLAAARCATGELDTAIQPFAHINLMPDHIDALALTVKVADKETSKDYLDLYYAMREDAATILAGVQPGDHGDAIIAAFGERAARMAILKAAGLPE